MRVIPTREPGDDDHEVAIQAGMIAKRLNAIESDVEDYLEILENEGKVRKVESGDWGSLWAKADD